MTAEELFEVMVDIDDVYIAEAHEAAIKKKATIWLKYALPAAACLCLLIVSWIPCLTHHQNPADNAGTDVSSQQTHQQKPDSVTQQDPLVSNEDPEKHLDKISFFFQGDRYKSASITQLKEYALVNDMKDLLILAEDNCGEYLGESENQSFADMNGLKLYRVLSIDETDCNLIVAEFPGAVFEYYCKCE